MSLISIAMATYNGENYLKSQLDSILNQTYKNIEIIICDDCSTDNTFQILKEYTKKYSNIYIYQNDVNLGFAKNFEKAITLCNGEYIALADQDDIWLPNKLEVLCKNIENYSVICSTYKIIDEHNNIISEEPISRIDTRIKILEKKQDMFKTLLFSNFVTGCTILMKKDFLNKILPLPESSYHDWWIALIASYYKELKYIDIPLILYRHHSNNETVTLRISNKIPEIYKAIYILYNEHYQQSKIKKYHDSTKILTNLINYITFEKDRLDFINSILDLNESILDFKLTLKDLKLIGFEFRNLKYISSKWNYFFFSIILRGVLKSKKIKNIATNY